MGIREEHEKSKRYWDDRAEPWSKSCASVSYLNQFYKNWNPRLGDPLIDVGCGSGKFLYQAVTGGRKDIYGSDISTELINITRDKIRPFLGEETDMRIIAMDMLDLSKHFDKGFFQSLIFSGVLQQTRYNNARRTLEQIAYISAHRAIIYFSTRSISTPPSEGILIDGEKGSYRLPEGIVRTYFTKKDIYELTKGLFEIIALNEKPQTEKISGINIMNLEGILQKI